MKHQGHDCSQLLLLAVTSLFTLGKRSRNRVVFTYSLYVYSAVYVCRQYHDRERLLQKVTQCHSFEMIR